MPQYKDNNIQKVVIESGDLILLSPGGWSDSLTNPGVYTGGKERLLPIGNTWPSYKWLMQ